MKNEFGQEAIIQPLLRHWAGLVFRTPTFSDARRGLPHRKDVCSPNLRKMADNTLYTQVRTMENHDDSVWDVFFTTAIVDSSL